MTSNHPAGGASLLFIPRTMKMCNKCSTNRCASELNRNSVTKYTIRWCSVSPIPLPVTRCRCWCFFFVVVVVVAASCSTYWAFSHARNLYLFEIYERLSPPSPFTRSIPQRPGERKVILSLSTLKLHRMQRQLECWESDIYLIHDSRCRTHSHIPNKKYIYHNANPVDGHHTCSVLARLFISHSIAKVASITIQWQIYITFVYKYRSFRSLWRPWPPLTQPKPEQNIRINVSMWEINYTWIVNLPSKPNR